MEFRKKSQYEYLRQQAKQNFYKAMGTWIECGRWALPHRIKWMLSQIPGERNNQHIVDSTHILSLRSYVAGFLEGNTSASRPWFRIASRNDQINKKPNNRKWLQTYTTRCLDCISNSNFYNAAAIFYYDFGVFNTGSHYIDEIRGNLFFHNLVPGSYFAINNGYNEAVVLVREMTLTCKALVETYGRKTKDGSWDWSNFSERVQKIYENGNYTQLIDIVHIVHQNEKFDPEKPNALLNKQWLSITYELGGMGGQYYQDGMEFGSGITSDTGTEVYLKISASKRKPFIIGKSDSGNNFEYGEKGPTSDALGIIKSLNKKAIIKDQALEQMIRPTLQGPASLKKSYITSAPNSWIPLDPTSMSQKGAQRVFDINPAFPQLLEDVSDLRSQVGKLYYADYLMYLSMNPKTRTATEADAVVKEQQLVIGPNLQSLNWTYNIPVVEFVMDFVLFEDPFLPPPPPDLAGQYLQAEFISVFAQAMKSADMPSINQYMQAIEQVGNTPGGAKIWDKANVDMYADIMEDRLFLPEGLNNPQGKVDAMRQQAQAAAKKQQMLEQTLPAVAGALRDASAAKTAGNNLSKNPNQ